MSGVDIVSDLVLLDELLGEGHKTDPYTWSATISLQPRIGGYVLIGRCSCPAKYVTGRDGGDGAWERVSKELGQHVKDVHLKKFEDWA